MLANGQRRTQSVKNRCLITLDADYAAVDFVDSVKLALGEATAYIIHPTRSHTEERPRYRVIIPLNRNVDGEEYNAISRKAAELIGMQYFDPTTFELARMMYLPSCSKDTDYKIYKGGEYTLSADSVLDLYEDWHDLSQLPLTKKEIALPKKKATKVQDPMEKKGWIGAFCRTYTISDVVEKFLSDVYTPTAVKNRYTYANGSSFGGMIAYNNDTLCYSNHATDPTQGMCCNAYDLLRIHRYGELDSETSENVKLEKLPSYEAMSEFMRFDSDVKEAFLKMRQQERQEETRKDFDFDSLFNSDKPHSDKENEGEKAQSIEEEGSPLEVLTILETDSKGNPKATVSNIMKILMHDSRLKGKIGLNEFTGIITVREALPWSDKANRQFDDADIVFLRALMEQSYGMTPTADNTFSAVRAIAQMFLFHPVREYLNSLRNHNTDEEYTESLLSTMLGAEDTSYTRAVFRKMLLGAVARIFEPAVKFDTMLVLVGPQGCGKSTLINKLGKNWFSDTFTVLQGKEAYEQLQGCWLIEIAELSAFKYQSQELIKGFISKRSDRYREPYARTSTDRPRQCVFFGTTNRYDFLKDPTGNRRFWAVDVGEKKPELDLFTDLTEDKIDTIWATACGWYEDYKSGLETLTLSAEEAKLATIAQREHSEEHPFEQDVIAFLNRPMPLDWHDLSLEARDIELNKSKLELTADGVERKPLETVCVKDIWVHVFKRPLTELQKKDSNLISDLILKTNEWKRLPKSLRIGSTFGPVKAYSRIDKEEERKEQ